jgi:hypothetical protein
MKTLVESVGVLFKFYGKCSFLLYVNILANEIKADLWRYKNDITNERLKIKEVEKWEEASFTYRSQKKDGVVIILEGEEGWSQEGDVEPCKAPFLL